MVFPKGTKVWVPDEKNLYVPGTVIESKEETTTVVLPSMVNITVPTPTLMQTSYSFEKQYGLDDMTDLVDPHEADVLFNLQRRTGNDLIYTWAGPILVALNPFKSIEGLHGDEEIARYCENKEAVLPPHVFGLADAAYSAVSGPKPKDQAVVINGEAGSGKTEIAKHVLIYLAACSSLLHGMEVGATPLEEKLIWCNAILEAFGNAETLLSPNSSRFGRVTRLQFREGAIQGGSVTAYALEKSRVCPVEGGRTYHIFYYLVEGAGEEERVRYKLRDKASYYNFLRDNVKGSPTSARFQDVKEGLAILGLEGAEQEEIFKILSAVALLGNVEYAAGTSSAVIKDSTVVQEVASLLGLKEDSLMEFLTKKVVATGGKRGSMFLQPLTASDAQLVRDTFAKFLYAGLFASVVGAMNVSLMGRTNATSAANILILDIFGFEVFPSNGIEQLLINYANERLQQLFVWNTFKRELALYTEEGLLTRELTFLDNAPCLEVLGGETGSIFSLLHESSSGSGNHGAFLQKVRELAKQAPSCVLPGTAHRFSVCHFAGTVEYEAETFPQRNADCMQPHGLELLKNSSNSLVSHIDQAQDSVSSSLSKAFVESMDELLASLSHADPHFIRCIRPNRKFAANAFEAGYVMQQLRSHGLIDTIIMKKACYPARFYIAEFCDRYFWLAEDEARKRALTAFAKAILARASDRDSVDWQIGTRRVFAKNCVVATLERLRSEYLLPSVLVLQRAFRVALAKHRVKQVRAQRKLDEIEGLKMAATTFNQRPPAKTPVARLIAEKDRRSSMPNKPILRPKPGRKPSLAPSFGADASSPPSQSSSPPPTSSAASGTVSPRSRRTQDSDFIGQRAPDEEPVPLAQPASPDQPTPPPGLPPSRLYRQSSRQSMVLDQLPAEEEEKEERPKGVEAIVERKVHDTVWDSRPFFLKTLDIHVDSGRHLPKKTSYYVRVMLLKEEGGTSKKKGPPRATEANRTMLSDVSDMPFWNENFSIDIPRSVHRVSFILLTSADQIIGEHVLDLPTDKGGSSMARNEWLDLSRKNGKKVVGSIRLGLNFVHHPVRPAEDYRGFLGQLDKSSVPLTALALVTDADARELAAGYLVQIYVAQGRLVEYLHLFITAEIDRLDDPNVIFRSNTLCTKSIEVMMRLIGRNFLVDTIGGIVTEICSDPRRCEVNPNLLAPGELSQNLRLLHEHCVFAWKAIQRGMAQCPPAMLAAFHLIWDAVEKKWGSQALVTKLAGVAGFLFLRFFIPAMLNPTKFNLRTSKPSADVTRTLTLVAKTLQNLANLKKFGNKEPYMVPMNVFIENERNAMMKLLTEAASRPPEKPVEITIMPDLAVASALLHKMFQDNETLMRKLPDDIEVPKEFFDEVHVVGKKLEHDRQRAMRGGSVASSTEVGAIAGMLSDPSRGGGVAKKHLKLREDNLMIRVRFPEKALNKVMVVPRNTSVGEVKAGVGVKLFMDKRAMGKYALFLPGGNKMTGEVEGGAWLSSDAMIGSYNLPNNAELLLLARLPTAPSTDSKQRLHEKFHTECLRAIQNVKAQRNGYAKLIPVSSQELANELKRGVVRCDVELTRLHRRLLELESLLKIDLALLSQVELDYRLETLTRLNDVKKKEAAGLERMLAGFTAGSEDYIKIEEQLTKVREELEECLENKRELLQLISMRASALGEEAPASAAQADLSVPKTSVQRASINLDPSSSSLPSLPTSALAKEAEGGQTSESEPPFRPGQDSQRGLKSDRKSKSLVCTMLFAFKGRDPQELSVPEGEEILIINDSDPTWWYAEYKGQYGAIPAAFLDRPG